jgi:hypothetical protein
MAKPFLLLLLVLGFSFPGATFAQWDFSMHSIPPSEIISGGPPRDGIPALFNPEYVSAEAADYLQDADQVLGVHLNGVARAYPLRILSWHELVNDDFGPDPILVSW